MSRPPSQQQQQHQQQMSTQKQSIRVPQQNDRALGSSKNSTYMNPNYLSSLSHHSQSQSKSNSREMRQQQNELNRENNSNNNNSNTSNNSHMNNLMHHIDSLPSSTGLSKKPSLLSGYHNPSFNANDRNDIMSINALALSGSIPRFYAPNQGPCNSSSHNTNAFMNGMPGNTNNNSRLTK